MKRLTAFLVVGLAAVGGTGRSETEIAMPETVPMGTTRGERVGRLVLRNATVVSGRGSENGNRAILRGPRRHHHRERAHREHDPGRPGEPAGLFDGKTVTAVFACNPALSLASLSGKDVEVQGFWAGGKDVKTFVPLKVRQDSGAWADVNCAEMP